MASCIKKEATRLCHAVPDIDSRAIPSRRCRSSGGASDMSTPGGHNSLVVFDPLNEGDDGATEQATKSRKSKVLVDLNAIWQLYEDSMTTNVSLPTLAKTRRRDRAAGMSEASVDYWMRKIQNIYGRRSAVSMSNCRFFSVACDASRHSTRDTLVSTVFSVENNVGVYANAQVLKSGGKLLAPDEAILDDEVEHLAATREIDRLASYRLMQAISFQLKFLTSKTLNSFLLEHPDPLAVALAPLTPELVRVVKQDAGGTRVYLCNKVTKESTLVDPSGASQKPILSLIMDQGRCGTAFAGYLAGTGCSLIHYGFLGCNLASMSFAIILYPMLVATFSFFWWSIRLAQFMMKQIQDGIRCIASSMTWNMPWPSARKMELTGWKQHFCAQLMSSPWTTNHTRVAASMQTSESFWTISSAQWQRTTVI